MVGQQSEMYRPDQFIASEQLMSLISCDMGGQIMSATKEVRTFD